MVARNEFTYPSSNGITQIHADEWIPDGEVRAVLQISHGMVEYVGRYKDFAEFLAGRGFYVTGNDHLGHGASVNSDDEHGFFGLKDGIRCVIQDMDRLRRMTQEKYPDKPYFLLGHSMGSFLLRKYISEYGKGLAGAIIMGTGNKDALTLAGGRLLCRITSLFHGWKYRSHLVNAIAFGSYNKKFEPARTPVDWLTKDRAVIDHYARDPWCSFTFTVNGYDQMFKGIAECEKPSVIDRIPKDLPVFFVSGKDDPVGGSGKEVEAAYEAFRKAGISDVTIKLYENDRHEILNEFDKETVYNDLLTWMTNHIQGGEV